jgi:hypothetical protein
MKLQRIRSSEGEAVCAISDLNGGEFTLCGNDAVCSVLVDKYNDDAEMEPIGDIFDGRLKDVTCDTCLAHIAFVKGLK